MKKIITNITCIPWLTIGLYLLFSINSNPAAGVSFVSGIVAWICFLFLILPPVFFLISANFEGVNFKFSDRANLIIVAIFIMIILAAVIILPNLK